MRGAILRRSVSRRVAIGAVALLAVAAIGAGCDGDTDDRGDGDGGRPAAGGAGAGARGQAFPAAPDAGEGPLEPEAEVAAERLVAEASRGELDGEALETVTASGDARLGWLLSDVLRFTVGEEQAAVAAAFEELSGADAGADPAFDESAWLSITDHLIAWDLPAPPGYRELKAELFETLEPGWAPFFRDADSEIDWRLVSWGGVLIDDRPFGDPRPCPESCIPALDDPKLTPAREGEWYPDERTVFGVVVNGEAVALSKNIMEVHEMVNMTLGGRRLGIPYCTLCGSAQAYLLDSVPDGVRPPVLRTSGLLSRSNKVMYDLRTRSVFDTFTGRALSGPLRDAGVELEQASVVASDWGQWRREHPETKILAEDGGIGRTYPLDPLGGRDDEGPIFPVGDVDPRLTVQEDVVGVVPPAGRPVAFPVERSLGALADGARVGAGGVEVRRDGNGLRAFDRDGKELPAHQAFWFAWSQFHPRTLVWGLP